MSLTDIRSASLALVRHGESTWIEEGRFQGRADPPLSAWGLLQARAVAERLAHPAEPPSLPLPPGAPLAIWHSPLERAAGTAGAIAEARGHDAPLVALEDLAELAQGDWEGLTHDQVRERFPNELAAWRSDPLRHHAPGGEPLVAARARARAAADGILRALAGARGMWETSAPGPAEPVLGYERPGRAATRYGSATPVPPTSADPVWALVVAHDGILRLLMLDLLGVPLERYWSFPFALASVTVIDIRDGLTRLRAHNLDEHIAALARS